MPVFEKNNLRKDHHRFMELALVEAEKAFAADEVPVGAVLTDCDGNVLSAACNQTISRHDPTAHAEISALRDAGQKIRNYRFVNTTLYVTVEPCIMCMGALLHARVSKIIYGAKDPKWGAAGSCYNLSADPRLNHVIDVEWGVLEKECRKLIQTFFKAKRAG